MNTEIDVINGIQESGIDDSGFDEKNLPQLLQGRISKLNELNESVGKAKQAAEDARTSADRAKSHSAGWFQKKAAIEELQSACVDLADAAQSGAVAQKISFEFQTKLADIAKCLFDLGAGNIAANRMVVRALELKLKGASKEELSELARREILLVVKQLKDQEDLLIKQENAAKAIKAHDIRLKENENISQRLVEQIEALAVADTDILKAIETHDVRLKEQTKWSKELEDHLHEQIKITKRQEEQLKAESQKIQNFTEEVQSQATADKRHEQQVANLISQVNLLQKKTIILQIGFVVAVVALIIVLLRFFI